MVLRTAAAGRPLGRCAHSPAVQVYSPGKVMRCRMVEANRRGFVRSMGSMQTSDDTTLLILNDLFLAARDAEKGFQTAADDAQDPQLVELFAGYALQRTKFAQELEERIRTL